MNEALVKSYARSIRRETRTLDQVPDPMREAVEAVLALERECFGGGE